MTMELRVLLISLLLGTCGFCVQVTQSLQWKGGPQNGSSLYTCVNDDVTFDWSYVTGRDEFVLATFWFSERKGTLATRFSSHSVTWWDKVTLLNVTDGLTLSSLSRDDAGLYGIQVKVMGRPQPDVQVINLVVVEPPQMEWETLDVLFQSQHALPTGNKTSCDYGGQLLCGPFTDVDLTYMSAVWTDPTDSQLNSSGFADGYFWLDLPAHPKGGYYNCTIVFTPEVSQCLQNGSASAPSASYYLVTTDNIVNEQGNQIDQLKTDLDEVKSHMGSNLQFLKSDLANHFEEKIISLENKTGNITEEVESLAFLSSRLRVHNDQLSEKLSTVKSSCDDRIHSLEQKLEQSLQSRGTEMAKKLSDMQTTLTKQQNDRMDNVTDLLNHLRTDFQQKSQAQESTVSRLQRQITALGDQLKKKQETMEEQNRTIAQLKAKTAELDTRHTEQAVNKINELAEHIARVEALVQNATTQQASDFSARLGRVKSEQQRRLEQVSSNVNVLQSQYRDMSSLILQQNQTLSSSVDTVQTTLLSKVDEVTKTLSAKLNRLETAQRLAGNNVYHRLDGLNSKQDNLTAAMDSLEAKQTTLSAEQAKATRETQTQVQNLEAEIRTVQENITNTSDRLQRSIGGVQQEHQQNYENLRLLTAGLKTTVQATSDTITQVRSRQSQTTKDVLHLNVSLNSYTSSFTTRLRPLSQRLDSLQTETSENFTSLLPRLLNLERQVKEGRQDGIMTAVNRTVLAATDDVRQEVQSLRQAVNAKPARSEVTSVQNELQRFVALSKKLHPIRLVNGTNELEGRVELLVGNQWGTVCDDGWGISEAKVVCAMLGFNRVGGIPKTKAYFGRGTGPIVLDDLKCTGNEDDIRVCPGPRPFGNHNCGHNEDAGVVCQR